MNASTFYLLSGLLAAAGLFLFYQTKRNSPGGRIEGAYAWTAAALSIAVACAAVVLGLVTFVQTNAIIQTSTAAGISSEQIVGKMAPDMTFRLVEDDQVKQLSDYQGDVILLNLWATWCAPCLQEMPDLSRFQESYRDRGVSVITISDEPRAVLQEFLERRPMETVYGYLTEDLAWPAPYNRVEEARPTTFVIDRQGIIRATWPGPATYDDFASVVAPFL